MAYATLCKRFRGIWQIREVPDSGTAVLYSHDRCNTSLRGWLYPDTELTATGRGPRQLKSPLHLANSVKAKGAQAGIPGTLGQSPA